MTGYRRACGRSRVPRRYVPWSEKVFYLEQSNKKIHVEARWHEGFFLGIKDESEVAVVDTPHRIVFARSIRRVPKEDSGDGAVQLGVEREIVNRVQLDVESCRSGSTSSTADNRGEPMPRRVYIRRALELVRYGYTDQCIGCQHARLGLKPAGHSEECRARIVKHMTADDDLSHRVQIAQQRFVATAPSEAQAGERDSVLEPARKKVRFAERVEEETPEGTVTTIPRSTSCSSSSSSSSKPTTIATSMQVDESDQDRSTRQKVAHGTDMELEWLVMKAEFDRLQRYADRSFLVHACKTQIFFDKIVLEGERSCEEGLVAVRCALHLFRWQKCFQILKKTCFVHRLGLTPGLALDWRTGWDLNDPEKRAKVWSHLQRERPILCWKLELAMISQGRKFLLYMNKMEICL